MLFTMVMVLMVIGKKMDRGKRMTEEKMNSLDGAQVKITVSLEVIIPNLDNITQQTEVFWTRLLSNNLTVNLFH